MSAEKSQLVAHAERELALIGMTLDSKSEINAEMTKCLLAIVRLFAAQGHSGGSANYAVDTLERLLKFEPLSPLTGADDEWNDVSEQSGRPMWQNNRCSRVFKDNEKAWDIEGTIFIDETGTPYASHDSRVDVTFPYTPHTEFVDAPTTDEVGHG